LPKLQILTQPTSGLHDLVARRQSLMKTLNHGHLKSYLNPLGLQAAITSIGSILNLADKTNRSHGRELQNNLQNLSETVREEIDHVESVPTFFVRNFVLPFLRNVQTEIESLQLSMAKKFDCAIAPPADVFEIPKKYPLHVTGTSFDLHIPLENTGPGIALNVRACCIAENCTVLTDETNLGDIDPAPFILTLQFSLDVPSDGLEAHVSIEWNVLGEPATRACDFAIRVLAQRTDLNWEALAGWQPYSLEVVGDEHFYGRRDALERLMRRLAPGSMQSCYITGQKRVGKSSLARAVEARTIDAPHDGDYHVLYLECGEIRHATGPDTLQEFGQRLESFLSELLPRNVEWERQDYSSSLTPLNRLLNSLHRELPYTRAVVIFDEFDEINEDLYRYGELRPVDSHIAATTTATGRAPPRSSRRSCRGASRSPAAPRSPRGGSPPDAASRGCPGHAPATPSGSAATGSPPPRPAPPDPPAAGPRRTPCRPRAPRTQGRPAPPPGRAPRREGS